MIRFESYLHESDAGTAVLCHAGTNTVGSRGHY